MEIQEVIPLLLGSIVLVVAALTPSIRSVGSAEKLLCASFLAWWVATVATVLENIVAANFLNIVEHAANALTGFLLVAAILRAGGDEARS